jgi:glucose/arabinose dehydrogenase
MKSSDKPNDVVTQSMNSSNSKSSLSFYFGELGDTRDNRVVATSHPEFVYHNNASGTIVFGDSSFWKDPLMSCQSTFECASDSTTGWKDNSSFRISTSYLGNNSWSGIYGSKISDIKPGETYNLFTHMKLNEYVVQSHIVLEGYNAPSQTWYTITHCPTGTNGPLDWSVFNCQITIPKDTTKIRLVLNAGWSSSTQHKAITWYDAVYIRTALQEPFLYDGNLKIEVVNEDTLELPTTMTFLGKDDFLVLEKNKGLVQRIINGSKLEKPLLDLNVSAFNGALGIAAIKPKAPQELNNASKVDAYVFIYYDESEVGDCSCKPNASRLYRYELVNNGTELANAKLFISLPIGGTYPLLHEGGPVKIGPDGNVYLMVGDIRSVPEGGIVVKNKAVNYNDGNKPDGRAGILRFNIEGGPVKKEGILGHNYPLNLYYAYGIRNSFGFTFDPVTGNMWDSENGPDYGDEINLVEPGFNSGWAFEMGTKPVSDDILFSKNDLPKTMVDFNGRGKYSPPEFVWQKPVGPTALTFLGSEQFGVLKNDLLAADYLGNIYHFTLNENRTKLIVDGGLDNDTSTHDFTLLDEDRTKLTLDGGLENPMPVIWGSEQASVFGGSFGIITDMQIGPDGNLYIVSESLGKIFKVGSNI